VIALTHHCHHHCLAIPVLSAPFVLFCCLDAIHVYSTSPVPCSSFSNQVLLSIRLMHDPLPPMTHIANSSLPARSPLPPCQHPTARDAYMLRLSPWPSPLFPHTSFLHCTSLHHRRPGNSLPSTPLSPLTPRLWLSTASPSTTVPPYPKPLAGLSPSAPPTPPWPKPLLQVPWYDQVPLWPPLTYPRMATPTKCLNLTPVTKAHPPSPMAPFSGSQFHLNPSIPLPAQPPSSASPYPTLPPPTFGLITTPLLPA